jgi:hypothetical protein
MHSPDPARKVALIREARHHCDVGQSKSVRPHKLERALKSKMNDEAVRAEPDRLSEDPREMRLAESRKPRKYRDIERLIEVFENVLFELSELVVVEHDTAFSRGERYRKR